MSKKKYVFYSQLTSYLILTKRYGMNMEPPYVYTIKNPDKNYNLNVANFEKKKSLEISEIKSLLFTPPQRICNELFDLLIANERSNELQQNDLRRPTNIKTNEYSDIEVRIDSKSCNKKSTVKMSLDRLGSLSIHRDSSYDNYEPKTIDNVLAELLVYNTNPEYMFTLNDKDDKVIAYVLDF